MCCFLVALRECLEHFNKGLFDSPHFRLGFVFNSCESNTYSYRNDMQQCSIFFKKKEMWKWHIYQKHFSIYNFFAPLQVLFLFFATFPRTVACWFLARTASSSDFHIQSQRAKKHCEDYGGGGTLLHWGGTCFRNVWAHTRRHPAGSGGYFPRAPGHHGAFPGVPAWPQRPGPEFCCFNPIHRTGVGKSTSLMHHAPLCGYFELCMCFVIGPFFVGKKHTISFESVQLVNCRNDGCDNEISLQIFTIHMRVFFAQILGFQSFDPGAFWLCIFVGGLRILFLIPAAPPWDWVNFSQKSSARYPLVIIEDIGTMYPNRFPTGIQITVTDFLTICHSYESLSEFWTSAVSTSVFLATSTLLCSLIFLSKLLVALHKFINA